MPELRRCGWTAERVSLKDGTCQYSPDRTHLVLNIVLGSSSTSGDKALGSALQPSDEPGYYGYVFYDRLEKLAKDPARKYHLLGCVMAHEIGHLVLGPVAHSNKGIMRSTWNVKELESCHEKTLLFTPYESWLMRSRLLSYMKDESAHREPSRAKAARSVHLTTVAGGLDFGIRYKRITISVRQPVSCKTGVGHTLRRHGKKNCGSCLENGEPPGLY
jgi:hypothetical protein